MYWISLRLNKVTNFSKKKKKLKSIRYHGHLCILNINVFWRVIGGVIEYEIAVSFFSGCWEPWGKDFLFLVIEICVLLFVEKEKEKEKYALCRLMIVLKIVFFIGLFFL